MRKSQSYNHPTDEQIAESVVVQEIQGVTAASHAHYINARLSRSERDHALALYVGLTRFYSRAVSCTTPPPDPMVSLPTVGESSVSELLIRCQDLLWEIERGLGFKFWAEKQQELDAQLGWDTSKKESSNGSS